MDRDDGFQTANKPGYDEEEKYKVWPTNQDRSAFRQVMDAGDVSELEGVRENAVWPRLFDIFSQRLRSGSIKEALKGAFLRWRRR